MKEIIRVKMLFITSSFLFFFEVYGATKTWNGSVSTNWNTAANWTNAGVPAPGDDVIIPASLTNYPNITSGQNISVKTLNINSGAIITLSGGTLNLSGNATIAGTFNQTAGTFYGTNFAVLSTGIVNTNGSFTTNNNKITIDGGTFNQIDGTVSTKDMELKNGGVYNQSNGEFQISHDLKVPVGTTYNGTGGTVRFTGAAGAGAVYTGNVQFFNLTIDPGANYNLQSGDVIKIAGNYINNNSSLDNSSGTLIFNGTSPQTIYSASSPASTQTIAANLIISNPVVTMLSNIGLHSSISFTNGGHIYKNGYEIYVGGSLYTGPTPVELISFSAYVNRNSVHLYWKTATETNNYGFEIERKSSVAFPIQDWMKIGFVNGNGNSNSYKEYSFLDANLPPSTYFYRLKQLDSDGTYSYSNIVSVLIDQIPNKFVLYQNYPNPFNPSTIINFTIAEESFVTLKIYNIIGTEILTAINEKLGSGSYDFTFNGSGLPSGIYFYKIQAGNFTDTRKMLLNK